MERRRKVEEQRRKKAMEEEKRKKKELEEERMKQQWEEEKQQKVEEEKHRLKITSQNSRPAVSQHSITPESDDFIDNYTKNQTPTPPPQPRPANTRKNVPKKQAPPKARSPSPLPGGDHVDLYEQAGALEGAYENVGHLKACFNCGRKFAEDRLQKHEKSCKNITKKRKVLDPSKLRTRGTEMEQYQHKRQPTPPQVKHTVFKFTFSFP